MLVDLGRNDLGRVCEFGSVEVLDLMLIEKYSHVMHLVSSLRGDLRKDLDRFRRPHGLFPLREPSPALQRCGPWRSSTH
jgi:anthranilate/para-aminobenzoate synthase component I